MSKGAFSYSGDPTLSANDEVRFLLQDTDRDDFELSNAEIGYLVATYGDPRAASIAGCNVLAVKYANLVDKTVGDLSISYGQRTQHFQDLAAHLTGSAGSTARPQPVLMGRTLTQKDDALDDTDRIGTAFRRGQDDYTNERQDERPLEKVWNA